MILPSDEQRRRGDMGLYQSMRSLWVRLLGIVVRGGCVTRHFRLRVSPAVGLGSGRRLGGDGMGQSREERPARAQSPSSLEPRAAYSRAWTLARLGPLLA